MQQFETIWDDTAGKIRGFIRGRVEDEATADDLIQEVFIRVHQNLPGLHNTERLESWIYQITRNVLIDHYRSRRPIHPLTETLPDPTAEAEEPDAAAELSGSLRRMVESLPEPYREALLLTEFGGLSQQDLALRLGISYSGAKSRVQRARKMIRDELLACCHFELDRYGRVIDYWEHCCCCAG